MDKKQTAELNEYTARTAAGRGAAWAFALDHAQKQGDVEKAGMFAAGLAKARRDAGVAK